MDVQVAFSCAIRDIIFFPIFQSKAMNLNPLSFMKSWYLDRLSLPRLAKLTY